MIFKCRSLRFIYLFLVAGAAIYCYDFHIVWFLLLISLDIEFKEKQ